MLSYQSSESSVPKLGRKKQSGFTELSSSARTYCLNVLFLNKRYKIYGQNSYFLRDKIVWSFFSHSQEDVVIHLPGCAPRLRCLLYVSRVMRLQNLSLEATKSRLKAPNTSLLTHFLLDIITRTYSLPSSWMTKAENKNWSVFVELLWKSARIYPDTYKIAASLFLCFFH